MHCQPTSDQDVRQEARGHCLLSIYLCLGGDHHHVRCSVDQNLWCFASRKRGILMQQMCFSGKGFCRACRRRGWARSSHRLWSKSRARDLASSEVFSVLMLRAFGLVCLIFVCANAGDMRHSDLFRRRRRREEADDNDDGEEGEWCEVLSVYVHVFLNTQVIEILRHLTWYNL